jgi:hypothetical protein
MFTFPEVATEKEIFAELIIGFGLTLRDAPACFAGPFGFGVPPF